MIADGAYFACNTMEESWVEEVDVIDAFTLFCNSCLTDLRSQAEANGLRIKACPSQRVIVFFGSAGIMDRDTPI